MDLNEEVAVIEYAKGWNRGSLTAFFRFGLSRSVTYTAPFQTDAASGLEARTVRGRNMVSSLLIVLLDKKLAMLDTNPEETLRAETGTVIWQPSRERPCAIFRRPLIGDDEMFVTFDIRRDAIQAINVFFGAGFVLKRSGNVPI